MIKDIARPRVADFLERHSKRWGAKVVILLQSMPDRPVHVLAISLLIAPPEGGSLSYAQVERLIRQNEAIPQTDAVTLKQVNNELNRLIKIKAWREAAGLPRDGGMEAAIDMLCAYHRETTRPNGMIKNFRLETEREYQRHRAAVRRLLKKAKLECPEAYRCIRSHLKTGTWFTWSSDLPG